VAFDGLRTAGVATTTACKLTGRVRASHSRRLRPPPVRRPPMPQSQRRAPTQALSPAEGAAALGVRNTAGNSDLSIRQVWARELDEGRYWCSLSSRYLNRGSRRADPGTLRPDNHPARGLTPCNHPKSQDRSSCEEHLQVIGDRQHRVRPTPPLKELQIHIQQRHPEPDNRLTRRARERIKHAPSADICAHSISTTSQPPLAGQNVHQDHVHNKQMRTFGGRREMAAAGGQRVRDRLISPVISAEGPRKAAVGGCQ
jgi:hypothetical protein